MCYHNNKPWEEQSKITNSCFVFSRFMDRLKHVGSVPAHFSTQLLSEGVLIRLGFA